jgi:hypothetical protein
MGTTSRRRLRHYHGRLDLGPGGRAGRAGSRRCCLVKLISQCVRLLSRIGSGQNLDEIPVPHSLLFSSVSKISSSLSPAHLAAVTPITSLSVPISQRTHRQPRTHWDPATSPCFIGSLFRRDEPIAWCWESGNSLHPLWATSTRILGRPHSTPLFHVRRLVVIVRIHSPHLLSRIPGS